MNILAQRVSKIIRESDIEYAEVGGAVMTLIWGCGLMFVHQKNLTIAPQLFGVSFILVALVQFWGIRQNDYAIRRRGAALACPVWAVAAALSFEAGHIWALIIGPQCLYFVVAAGWAYVRMRKRHEFRAWREHYRGQINEAV